jgi:hypothetical protein
MILSFHTFTKEAQMSHEWKIVTPEGDDGAPYPWNWMTMDSNVYRQAWWSRVQAGQVVRWTREDSLGNLVASVFLTEEADAEWAAQHSGTEKSWAFDHRGLRARLVPQECWEAHQVDLEVGITAVAA